MDPKHRRRILFSGFAILAVSFIAGVVLSFYQWDHGSPFDLSNWSNFNPIGRATYGPLALAVILFPVTLPLLLLVSVLVWVGMKKQRLWPLSLVSFIGLGLLWLWYLTELWQFD